MSARWGRGAAALLLALALVAGCSSSKDEKGSSSSTSSTAGPSDTVSLEEAARVVQQAAPDLPADQAAPLLSRWCAAARSGDRTPLVAQLRQLPAMSEPVLDEILGALQKGAEQRCPKDAATRPDLLAQTYDELISSTTTTAAAAPANLPSTMGGTSRTASVRTGTTVRRSSATTAAPTTTAASSTTTTTDLCSNVGGGSNGVSVGNGGASSCSRTSGG